MKKIAKIAVVLLLFAAVLTGTGARGRYSVCPLDGSITPAKLGPADGVAWDFDDGDIITTADIAGINLKIDHIAENTGSHSVVFDNNIIVQDDGYIGSVTNTGAIQINNLGTVAIDYNMTMIGTILTLGSGAASNIQINFVSDSGTGYIGWDDEDEQFDIGNDVFFNQGIFVYDAIDFGVNTIADENMTGDWGFTGDLIFVGSGNGLCYGAINQTGGASFTTTLTNQSTWYELDAGTTNISAGELNLCTFPGDHYLLVTKAGKYIADYQCSAEIDSVAGGAQHIELGFMVNGTIVANKGISHWSFAATSTESQFYGGTILALSANAQVSLGAINDTSAAKILTIDHLNLRVVQIGGT